MLKQKRKYVDSTGQYRIFDEDDVNARLEKCERYYLGILTVAPMLVDVFRVDYFPLLYNGCAVRCWNHIYPDITFDSYKLSEIQFAMEQVERIMNELNDFREYLHSSPIILKGHKAVTGCRLKAIGLLAVMKDSINESSRMIETGHYPKFELFHSSNDQCPVRNTPFAMH